MVCFCSSSMGQLRLALPSLNAALDASADLSETAVLRLAATCLPFPPLHLEPSWIDLELPTVSLSASAIATLSAFAQLRASVMAALGIDLAIPGQAAGFVRLAATLNARLSAMASLSLSVDASAWIELSATLTAILQVHAALTAGLYASVTTPPGPEFQLFILRIRALLPVIAVSLQMGITATADLAVQLSAALQVMMRIGMPGMGTASLSLMATLTAGLSAVAQIRLNLGIDPFATGIAGVRAMVAARARATMQLAASLGIDLSLRLPLPQIALGLDLGLAITPAVVRMAASLDARAIASMNWQVPAVASLPVLSVGLPVIAFTAQLNAALGISAATGPCGVCDAAAVVAAAMHAAI